MIARERRELVELLRTLTPEQWQTESLCAGWRISDVVAHLLYEATPPARYVGELIRARGSVDRHNEHYIARGRTMTTEELLAAYEATVDSGLAARWAPRIGLADTMIHQQDIRRPLGATRRIPAPHLLTLLKHPDPTLHPRPRMRGLRFHATDVDWQHGTGPLVQGPGEAIFMAVAGRTIVLDELTGGGVDILRGRLR
ncbi:maleylpyruvate isomerase family mycothiol-dependent enzyme [Nocardia sp. 2]|uniref:Maleylpyruvate isomerase family mycothiol-dependent enzyme n=1 Tax=Nocardia acididurans TaxID=2802282 RepID=A0ABS1MGW0_9NOCA|nr:maleylpyruvate isomerase family mycothiol-dependent enzyme [Nocardia acididurans]MBL1079275.1 maleylpyruvate isomerase family mycothiol-dependent enzyme [Nocardia acididurans]